MKKALHLTVKDMAPYRPNRKKNRSKYNIMSDDTTQSQEVQTPEINVGDLTAVLQLINVVTERGAFRGAELSSVGAIHDRVKAFVDFHTPKEEASDESTDDATDGAAETEESAE